jgi:hypothetical protein
MATQEVQYAPTPTKFGLLDYLELGDDPYFVASMIYWRLQQEAEQLANALLFFM